MLRMLSFISYICLESTFTICGIPDNLKKEVGENYPVSRSIIRVLYNDF